MSKLPFLAGVMLVLAASTPGRAVTYNYIQTTEGCTGGCAISSNNTVQVSDTTVPDGTTALGAGVFDILVTLDTNWSFQKNKYAPNPADTLGTGHAASFLFSTSLTLNSLTIVSPPTSTDFHVETSNPGGNGTQMSPWVFSANAYGVSQNTSNSNVYSVIDLRVDTGTTDTLAQFIATLLAATANGKPDIFFAADAQDGTCGLNCGNTGTIGFTFDSITNPGGGAPPPAVPLPPALPLFASGLLGMFWLSKRKKRKA